MTSEKQIAANRNNASHSTGPRTEAGKNRSRLNACRHNLTGQVSIMTEDDRIALDRFSKDLIQDLAPEGSMEFQLARRIATDSWRLNRASAIEDNIYALGLQDYPDHLSGNPQIDDALSAARVFTAESEQLQRLALYEQRLNRAIQRNLALLQTLQAARKAAREARMREAKLLLQNSERKGHEYQPARDGFVFSNAEIHAAIDRDRRLERASHAGFGAIEPGQPHAHAA